MSMKSLEIRKEILIGRPLSEIPPNPPEAVKKFRQREIRGPRHVRGRVKFTPPKQALVSPGPARYLTHWNRGENSLVLKRIFLSCQRRSAEVGEVLHGHPIPAGFWRREFDPPPDNKRGSSLPSFEYFHSFPLIKGGRGDFWQVRHLEENLFFCYGSAKRSSIFEIY